MHHFRIVLIISVSVLLISCYDREREQRLTLRERNLAVREKEFELKEAEFIALIRMRDSLRAIQDTTLLRISWPPEIEGFWSGKTICTESNCSDYVVGDLRNDTWQFTNDSLHIVTKVMSNNQVVRVYSSVYARDLINLKYQTDSSATRQVAMNVLLNEISPTKMRGIRTVSVDDKCTARFNVELTRIPNK